MKLRSLAFVLVLLPALAQQECDLQKAIEGDIEQTINTELMTAMQKYFPRAERIYHPKFAKAIVIDTAVSGVSEQFARELVPQLSKAGLHKLGEARRKWYGGFIPYESVVFLFNAPPGFKQLVETSSDADIEAPKMLLVLWFADHNAGVVLSNEDMERCEGDFSPCEAKMMEQMGLAPPASRLPPPAY